MITSTRVAMAAADSGLSPVNSMVRRPIGQGGHGVSRRVSDGVGDRDDFTFRRRPRRIRAVSPRRRGAGPRLGWHDEDPIQRRFAGQPGPPGHGAADAAPGMARKPDRVRRVKLPRAIASATERFDAASRRLRRALWSASQPGAGHRTDLQPPQSGCRSCRRRRCVHCAGGFQRFAAPSPERALLTRGHHWSVRVASPRAHGQAMTGTVSAPRAAGRVTSD